ncbi:MAG: MATE family efflux transporter [Clostridia bacterium]|nr:MATE family efflux transporter [Clostridia bacterium]
MGKKTDILNFGNIDNISRRSMMGIVWSFSIPAILAQFTSVVMQYIDAAMVGSLGAGASAAIGLVSTTTWLMNGLCTAAVTGFSVQIAQLIGAKRDSDARSVFRQAFVLMMCFGLFMSVIAFSISSHLPAWLGGAKDIRADSSKYFSIFALILPATQIRQLCAASLQCSGDMKTPSALSIAMCFMNVIFNFLFIYPSRTLIVFGNEIKIFGVGLGVSGAAYGTALAEYITAILMLWRSGFKSKKLSFWGEGTWKIRKQCIKTALRVSLPAAFEHMIICGAYICSTVIIAPLGKVPVAANSLAVTAESFCYMPGYGIGSASTTLVGQSLGAGRSDVAKRFASTAVFLGVAIMTVTGALMFVIAPLMFSLLTPDTGVRMLGTDILRIEAFAEPLYAASIICAGALRGAGDTFVPSLLNLASMWGVRITLSFILVPHFGLHGAWIAMATELCVRGILFLIRLYRGKWAEKKLVV